MIWRSRCGGSRGGFGRSDRLHAQNGRRFGFGPFVSPNLTPDGKGRPAGLTFRQFADAIRKGHDPDDPSKILQVMPWPVYANTTYDDLDAIYTYLRAIPSLPD